jgi:hypothetical protein
VAKKIPEWAKAPLTRFLDHCEESHRLLHMSMQGICGLRGIPQALEVLEETRREDDPVPEGDARARLKEARERAKFAEAEIERGFPLLHAHALIGLWASFEAAIEDVLVAFLMNQSEILQHEAFAKLRVPLCEFEMLEKDERMRFLISEFERNQGLSRKHGVDRFEVVLAPFGLSGAVDPEIKKKVREMHFIRNVLVHRAGIADRRLVQGCPWLGLQVGQSVIITHEAAVGYENALGKYLVKLIHRLRLKFGVDAEGDENRADSEAAGG